ncbi:Sec-independent protein translocase protein TatB [Endozoicomonas montiporae]
MELLLIAVIALVVLGPERLPGAIRTTAYWVGKLRRSFQNAREELERELNVEEIKRQIHNENVMRELEKTKASVNESLNEPLEEPLKELFKEPFKETTEAMSQSHSEGEKSQSDGRTPASHLGDDSLNNKTSAS